MRPRLRSIGFALAGAAAISTAVVAAPLVPRRATLSQTPSVVRADTRCGPGWHWVPPGYARHGKWRDGHCSPDRHR